LRVLNIQQNYFIYIIIIAAISRLLTFVFEEQTLTLLILISVIRIFMNKDYILTYSFIKEFLVITAGYVVLMSSIGGLGKYMTEEVNVHRLKRGMVLAESVTKSGLLDTQNSVRKDQLLIKPENMVLSEQDITLLRTMHIRGKLHFNNIRIKQTINFAPFIFTGIILTIMCKGNIIIFIRNLL
jgi:hypothetical protein